MGAQLTITYLDIDLRSYKVERGCNKLSPLCKDLKFLHKYATAAKYGVTMASQEFINYGVVGVRIEE